MLDLSMLVFGNKLRRICCNKRLKQGKKTCRVESSLKRSKKSVLNRVLLEDHLNIDEAVTSIMTIKSIRSDAHPQFAPALRVCLCQIHGYRQLRRDAEALQKTPYFSGNAQHEAMLQQFWSLLRPDEPLRSRITSQWTDIGFQGNDPMTDFRGMGVLGLENLLFFVCQYTSVARQLLSHSNHPQYGYPFSIVGINITSLALNLLNGGHLKTHFYNVISGPPLLQHFHHVYCCLFYEFDKFWISEQPRDIMEFNRIKSKFHKKLIDLLKDESCILRSDLTKHMEGDHAPSTSVPSFRL